MEGEGEVGEAKKAEADEDVIQVGQHLFGALMRQEHLSVIEANRQHPNSPLPRHEEEGEEREGKY